MLTIRIKDIENFFEENFPKKTFSLLSLDEENKISLIISEKLSFSFDEVVKKEQKIIKTSDTIFFKTNKIIFVEFKSGKIGNIEFRLKSIESIFSFYNYIYSNNFKESLIFPNDIFEIYFVYSKKSSSAMLNTFAQIEREFISSRTKEALAKRKADGFNLGRPKGQSQLLKLDAFADEIRGYLKKGINKRAISKLIECSPSTLYLWLKRRKLYSQSK